MQCDRCGRVNAADCDCGMNQPSFSLFGTSFQGDKVVGSPISDDARRQLVRGPAIAAFAFLVTLTICLMADLERPDSAVAAVLALYSAWSTYWGLLGIRRYATDRGDGLVVRLLSELASTLSVYGFVLVPLAIGVLYGALGGWYPEFVSALRLARDPNSVLERLPNRPSRGPETGVSGRHGHSSQASRLG